MRRRGSNPIVFSVCSPLISWTFSLPYDKLKWLCNYFNVSSDYLLGISNVRLPYNYTPPKPLNNDEQQAIIYYSRLNEENKIFIKGKMIELHKEQTLHKKVVKKTTIG